MNLVTLRNRLNAWAGRIDADYVAERDGFINQAIREIARRVGVEVGLVELVASQAVSQGDESFVMPAELRNTSDNQLAIINADGTRTVLRQIQLGWLNERFYDSQLEEIVDLSNPAEQAKPLYYALAPLAGTRRVHLRRVPDAAYTIEIRGVRYTTDLISDSDENYVALEAPDAVLFKALEIAWTFFEDVGRASLFAAKAEPLIAEWKNQRIEAFTAAMPLQMSTYEA